MDPQRAAKLGVDPAEVKITCHGGMYAGRWILWIPNDRYEEADERYKQILTEGGIHYLTGWRASLMRYAHGT